MPLNDTGSQPEPSPEERQDTRSTPAVDTSPIRPWSALAYRDYRMLWISGVAQMITMQMRLLVTGVWLYEETGSGVQLGLLGIVQLAVQLPAVLYGGALADQIDRKKLMSYSQTVSFVLLVGLTALVATDHLRAWHIYATTAILGVASTLGNPARSALTANVVPRTHLMHAVTTNTATFQVGAVISPLVFAWTITSLGFTATFATAAAIAVPGIILPLMIRVSGIPQDRSTETSMLRRMWQGFLFIKSHPILPGLYVMDVGVTIVSHYRQIMPLMADRLFKAGPGAVGVMTAANSVGGIAGTFAVLFLTSFRAKGMLVMYATLAFALLLIALGFTTALWLGVVILIGLGATDAIGMATRQTTVQLTTPDNMRGRAVSFNNVAAMSANNIGTFEVGFMSEQIGAGNTMLLAGGVGLVVVLLVWRSMRAIRDYRYP
ncbi:MAG: MFS transporter [Chloroflexi bacterium]|nr:MFS transporter [Chloroflexota bacterium]